MVNELTHHGVKGMKWGIRKKPASSGGGKRPAKKKVTKSSLFDRKKKAKEVAQEEDIEAKKAKVLKSRSARELYKNAHLFSTQELQSAYNRLQLERNISNLAPQEVSKGKQIVDKMISIGDTTSKLLTTGSRLYNNVASIYNSLTEQGRAKPMPKIGNAAEKKKDDKKKD